MKINLLILIISCLASVAACTHIKDTPQPAPVDTTTTGGNNGGGASNGGGNTPDTALCFERDILPIFISNCAKGGCHDAATAEEGYVFTSYATITSKKFKPWDAEHTELYEAMTEDEYDKIMPPPPDGPLKPEQIALVRNWIERGAPNSINCSTGDCDSTEAGFAATIQPLLNTNCKGCHNANLASGGIRLDNHAGAAAAANSGQLLGAVRHDAGFTPMPQGGNKLNDCQIAQITRWVANGTPND